MAGNKIRRTRFNTVFDVVNATLMGFLLIVILYPLYFTVIASISDPYSVISGKVVFLPVNVTLEAYRNVIRESKVWVGYRNTIFYTVFGTLFNLFLTIPAAYMLSKKNLCGRGLIATYFMIIMFFSGGLIPTYLQIKSLGLLNKWYTLIVLEGFSVYNMIVTRTFFQNSIPEEIFEASKIDGANEFQNFFLIAMPLAKAIIAVITLYYAVSRWNSYFTALIYTSKESYQPLQIVLRNILISNQTALQQVTTDALDPDAVADAARKAYMAEGMKYSLIFISSAPLLAAYPFVQKYFVKGVMLGSIKG